MSKIITILIIDSELTESQSNAIISSVNIQLKQMELKEEVSMYECSIKNVQEIVERNHGEKE